MKTKSLLGKSWRFVRARKWLSAVLLLLLAGLVVYGIWHFLNSPVQGDIKISTASPSSRQKLPEYETLENDQFSLSYSGKYIAVPTETSSGDIVTYSFESKTNDLSEAPTDKFSVSLRPAPFGGITLDRDYIKYSSLQKEYKFSNKYFHGEAIDLAIKQTGGTDQVALWLHNSYVLAVKLTKPTSQKSLDLELKDILTSVQWVQN